ncbi:MAG: hemerythrin domain-containing protein [Candidatus Bathyarchaeota archaeon]|nr:hemerythrin domain-containing protein [Candidatus Bathyarchaeota archaeon]
MENVMDEEMKKEEESIRKNATIYDLLKLEHKDVKKLFKQILDSESFQSNIYNQASKSLAIHLDAEEKVFYTQLINNRESRSETIEGFEEHDVARKIMKDIDDSTDNDVKFAKFKVLTEVVSQHVDDEEGDIYRKAKKVLSKEQEQEIAKQFMNEKMSMMNLPSSPSATNPQPSPTPTPM